jgi:lipid II:glycine glycyltransferase (peptidoglycan interpeptide bridge formation enzyme)
MEIRPVTDEECALYDNVVDHPVQSWQWGQFKKETGQQVARIGFFDNGVLKRALQATFHRVPVLGGTVGYMPKAFAPDTEQLEALQGMARIHGAIFTKIEPNVSLVYDEPKAAFETLDSFLLSHGGKRGDPLFTKYDFHLNMLPDEDALFANLNSKTRYNVRLAQKKGVEIVENTSEAGMETFITLMLETTNRQHFFSHTAGYYRTMWRVLGCVPNSMLHIFQGCFNGDVLVSWIVFLFNGKLYYPYGASSDRNREVMASNLMMWHVIQFGKAHGCTDFDMWGALGPNPDVHDPFYGFHHFKQGYNPVLMENLGTYDVVYKPAHYRLFGMANKLRWRYLRLKKSLKSGQNRGN